MDESNHEKSQHQNKTAHSQKWVFLGVIVFVIVVIGFLLFRQLSNDSSRPSPQAQTNPLNSVKSTINFPLYYPAQLPAGFELKPNSASNQEGAVFYSYIYNGNEIIVTQQPKPRIMEEVKKTREFDTSIGKAYIADLEGKVTGFIVTDKTLIILSNANKNDGTVLEQLMRNFESI